MKIWSPWLLQPFQGMSWVAICYSLDPGLLPAQHRAPSPRVTALFPPAMGLAEPAGPGAVPRTLPECCAQDTSTHIPTSLSPGLAPLPAQHHCLHSDFLHTHEAPACSLLPHGAGCMHQHLCTQPTGTHDSPNSCCLTPVASTQTSHPSQQELRLRSHRKVAEKKFNGKTGEVIAIGCRARSDKHIDQLLLTLERPLS